MTAMFREVGEFVESQEDWSQYANRLTHIFIANDVTDVGEKQAILLSVVGPRLYKLLSSLLVPATPEEKDFGKLVQVPREHYSPPLSEIVQQYKFNSSVRQPGESVTAYVAELQDIKLWSDIG